jgi:hypothetical protein
MRLLRPIILASQIFNRKRLAYAITLGIINANLVQLHNDCLALDELCNVFLPITLPKTWIDHTIAQFISSVYDALYKRPVHLQGIQVHRMY